MCPGPGKPAAVQPPCRRGDCRVEAQATEDLSEPAPVIMSEAITSANDRLKNAPVGRRKPAKDEPALLSGVLFCARCRAPMYRIKAWQGLFDRCAGTYPQRKGCGNMVGLPVTDMTVAQILSLSAEPWKDLRLIEGENHDVELADIALQLQDLPSRNLPDTEEDAERARLRAERDRLTELNKHARPDRWDEMEMCTICASEYQDTCEASGHPMVTVGEHWASLDHESRRAVLLENVKVYAEVPDPELRKIGSGPKVRIESPLFRLPVTWVDPAV